MEESSGENDQWEYAIQDKHNPLNKMGLGFSMDYPRDRCVVSSNNIQTQGQ